MARKGLQMASPTRLLVNLKINIAEDNRVPVAAAALNSLSEALALPVEHPPEPDSTVIDAWVSLLLATMEYQVAFHRSGPWGEEPLFPSQEFAPLLIRRRSNAATHSQPS